MISRQLGHVARARAHPRAQAAGVMPTFYCIYCFAARVLARDPNPAAQFTSPVGDLPNALFHTFMPVPAARLTWTPNWQLPRRLRGQDLLSHRLRNQSDSQNTHLHGLPPSFSTNEAFPPPSSRLDPIVPDARYAVILELVDDESINPQTNSSLRSYPS